MIEIVGWSQERPTIPYPNQTSTQIRSIILIIIWVKRVGWWLSIVDTIDVKCVGFKVQILTMSVKNIFYILYPIL